MFYLFFKRNFSIKEIYRISMKRNIELDYTCKHILSFLLLYSSWLRHLNVKDWLVQIVLDLVSRFIFPFVFVLILIWKQLVKTDKIRGLNQLFTPCFFLINNYCMVHQKNHIKNNNNQTFNYHWPRVYLSKAELERIKTLLWFKNLYSLLCMSFSKILSRFDKTEIRQ